MNNQEKAKELGTTIWKEWNDSTLATGAEKGAMLMAEWKDQQIKEYLEKKNTEISNTKAKLDKVNVDYMLCTLKSLFLDEIINELFGETEQDNSNREE